MFLLLNRRQFLKSMAASAAASQLAGLTQLPFALAQSAGDNTGKSLIILNLEGAVDSFFAFPYNPNASVVQPITNIIGARRSSLNVPPAFLHPSANYIGFHPTWTHLQSEINLGTMRMIQGVGVSPNQPPGGSHQFCQNCYSYGERNFTGNSRGWFARSIERFDLTHNQAFGFGTRGRIDFATFDPAKAPIVGQASTDLTYVDDLGPQRASVNLATARQLLAAADTPQTAAEQKILDALRTTYDVNELMAQINNVTLTRPFLEPNVRRPAEGNRHWISISKTMKSIARVLKFYNTGSNIDSRNRLFYAFQEGFDTHGNEAYIQGFLLDEVALALADFAAEMRNTPHPRGGTVWDHTVIIAISEFGRNAYENGGAGSDHGWGATLFALGGSVRGGVAGDPPDVNHLNQYSEIRATIDFPNLLKAGLDWMGYDGSLIFPNGSYLPSSNLGIFSSNS